MNIKENRYEVFAVLPTGERKNISAALTSLSWGDSMGELAAKAEFQFPAVGKGVELSNQLALCTIIQVHVNHATVFDGIVWEHEYSHKEETTTKIIAYDKLIYATKSKDNGYWSQGRSTQSIVSDICKKWGLNLNYTWGGINHQKVVLDNASVVDQIVRVIQDAEKQIGKTSVITLDGAGTLCIDYQGANQPIYEFKAKTSILSISRRRSLETLVTRVIIVSKGTEDATIVENTVDGKTEYGILQEIVQKSGKTTMDEAKKEANELLVERGKPQDILSVLLPDVPTVRRGHKIKLTAPDLDDFFVVSGVTHNADDRTMDVQLVVSG